MAQHDTVTVSREQLNRMAEMLDRTAYLAIRAINWDRGPHSAEGHAVLERIDMVRFQIDLMTGVKV